MLAYDAVLYALQVREKEGALKAWESLCAFGMFHCGDSDSTGIISAAIWGAMFGFQVGTIKLFILNFVIISFISLKTKTFSS